jgi:CRISPR-associated endoribonuclease Cas6
MHRIRLCLPKGQWAVYRHLDLIHDAIVNALIASGAHPGQIIGAEALPWTFAPLGFHRNHEGKVHGLVISTPSQDLAAALNTLDPGKLRYARASTGELFNFADATVEAEPPPILPEQAVLGALTLSPIAISDRSVPGKRWHTHLDQVNLSEVANTRLSRIAARQVSLSIQPDSLYLRANPRHSILVSTKRMKNGKSAYVIAMESPMVLAGSREDVLLAWYAGIGEKTRNGFGCLGLAEEGVGR